MSSFTGPTQPSGYTQENRPNESDIHFQTSSGDDDGTYSPNGTESNKNVELVDALTQDEIDYINQLYALDIDSPQNFINFFFDDSHRRDDRQLEIKLETLSTKIDQFTEEYKKGNTLKDDFQSDLPGYQSRITVGITGGHFLFTTFEKQVGKEIYEYTMTEDMDGKSYPTVSFKISDRDGEGKTLIYVTPYSGEIRTLKVGAVNPINNQPVHMRFVDIVDGKYSVSIANPSGDKLETEDTQKETPLEKDIREILGIVSTPKLEMKLEEIKEKEYKKLLQEYLKPEEFILLKELNAIDSHDTKKTITDLLQGIEEEEIVEIFEKINKLELKDEEEIVNDIGDSISISVRRRGEKFNIERIERPKKGISIQYSPTANKIKSIEITKYNTGFTATRYPEAEDNDQYRLLHIHPLWAKQEYQQKQIDIYLRTKMLSYTLSYGQDKGKRHSTIDLNDDQITKIREKKILEKSVQKEKQKPLRELFNQDEIRVLAELNDIDTSDPTQLISDIFLDGLEPDEKAKLLYSIENLETDDSIKITGTSSDPNCKISISRDMDVNVISRVEEDRTLSIKYKPEDKVITRIALNYPKLHCEISKRYNDAGELEAYFSSHTPRDKRYETKTVAVKIASDQIEYQLSKKGWNKRLKTYDRPITEKEKRFMERKTSDLQLNSSEFHFLEIEDDEKSLQDLLLKNEILLIQYINNIKSVSDLLTGLPYNDQRTLQKKIESLNIDEQKGEVFQLEDNEGTIGVARYKETLYITKEINTGGTKLKIIANYYPKEKTFGSISTEFANDEGVFNVTSSKDRRKRDSWHFQYLPSELNNRGYKEKEIIMDLDDRDFEYRKIQESPNQDIDFRVYREIRPREYEFLQNILLNKEEEELKQKDTLEECLLKEEKGVLALLINWRNNLDFQSMINNVKTEYPEEFSKLMDNEKVLVESSDKEEKLYIGLKDGMFTITVDMPDGIVEVTYNSDNEIGVTGTDRKYTDRRGIVGVISKDGTILISHDGFDGNGKKVKREIAVELDSDKPVYSVHAIDETGAITPIQRETRIGDVDSEYLFSRLNEELSTNDVPVVPEEDEEIQIPEEITELLAPFTKILELNAKDIILDAGDRVTPNRKRLQMICKKYGYNYDKIFSLENKNNGELMESIMLYFKIVDMAEEKLEKKTIEEVNAILDKVETQSKLDENIIISLIENGIISRDNYPIYVQILNKRGKNELSQIIINSLE